MFIIWKVYRAKLTVEDNFGNTGSVVHFVNAKPASAFASAEGQANLFGAINQNQIPTMVVSLVLFAIVTLSLYLNTIKPEKLEGAGKKRKK